MTIIMKKILFAALMLTALLFTSCDNDDIEIVYEQSNYVTVSLTDFLSRYPSSDFSEFNSKHQLSIVTRVLFYNSNGLLVDSILNFSTNTDPVRKEIRLANGKYTAIATLTFAYSDKSQVWDLVDRENLNTAYITNGNYIPGWWYIMSYASKEFSVESGKSTELQLTPTPVGSYMYCSYSNFQYASKTDYSKGKVSDNKLRVIGILTQKKASGYKLNPASTEKYIYEATSSGSNWWYLDRNEPDDYGWTTYFRDDMGSGCYILAPECNITFGYVEEGHSGFESAGEDTYSFKSGATYIAYWDYLGIEYSYPFISEYRSNAPKQLLTDVKQYFSEKTKIDYTAITQCRKK